MKCRWNDSSSSFHLISAAPRDKGTEFVLNYQRSFFLSANDVLECAYLFLYIFTQRELHQYNKKTHLFSVWWI